MLRRICPLFPFRAVKQASVYLTVMILTVRSNDSVLLTLKMKFVVVPRYTCGVLRGSPLSPVAMG